MKQKILVIDDEEFAVRLLRRCLEAEGYDVVSAGNGAQGLQVLVEQSPDLVLLDLMMPGIDGWEVCRQIREITSIPVIMLSAVGSDSAKVRGLNQGADDYVTKPYSMPELVARVNAALRRYRMNPTEGLVARIDERLTVDRARRRIVVEGQRVELSPTEYRILTCFLDNPDRTLTHQSLLTQVWGWEYMDEIDYLKVYIHRLRRKIEPTPQKPRYILTERGLGYRFQVPHEVNRS
jgi:two-component system KDP operon response regulator KdpE